MTASAQPPVWNVSSELVKLSLTQMGGHMAPVRFDLGNGETATPYSLPPWSPEDCDAETPDLLKILRGDFFCLPFGVSEATPHPHGLTANGDWDLEKEEPGLLQAVINDPHTGARVRKTIQLNPGERAIYQSHTITGLTGRYNYGHHPILQFQGNRPCAIRTGPIRFGQVYPGPFEDPVAGGYSCLKAGGRFDSLESVPLANGGTTSLAEYPAREGFEDLVMFAAEDPDFGWTAVHFPGFVWLALKNCRELPSTLFWHSNGGRHYAPWNSVHRYRLGIEDVCSYFHEGAEISAEDRLAAEGIETSRSFVADQPVTIHHIQLVHPMPAEFGTVTSVSRDPSGNTLILHGSGGRAESVPVNWKFLA